MTIKCGNCGQDIVVPDNMAVGQHVKCPYCHEKSAFDRPSRIELPEGFETKRQARAKINELKRAHELKASAFHGNAPTGEGEAAVDPADRAPTVEVPRPKIALRRPAQETKDREHTNAAVEAIHDRIRKVDRRKRVMAFKKSFGNFVSIVALIAVAVIGFIVWKAVQKKAVPAYVPTEVTDIVNKVVDQVSPTIVDEAEKARRAEEAKELKRIQEEQIRRAREAEIAKLDAEHKQNAELYERAATRFREGRFAIANHGKIAGALGKRTEPFFFCLSDEGAEIPIFEVASASNGSCRVTRRCADGHVTEEPLDAFTNRLAKTDYLMAYGKQVCFRSTQKTPMTGRLRVDKSTNPTELFFGDMAKTVTGMGLNYDELTFEIVFSPKNSKKEITVQSVEFGCSNDSDEIRKAVVEAFPPPNASENMRIRKFKRTVMFWDGNMIKRGMHGETYVPRKFWYDRSSWKATHHGVYDRWARLRDQVYREESEEREYYANERRRIDEKLKKINTSAQEKWKKSIDDMLETGTLVYRAKIAKEN